MNLFVRLGVVAVATNIAIACDGGGSKDASREQTRRDSIVAVSDVATIPIRSTRGLVENSSAAMSVSQTGVLFSINDSGHEPELFAIDTSGADRGLWRIRGASNMDWEATAVGPCKDDKRPRCVYIGDVGDNDTRLPSRRIYRVVEPEARDSVFRGKLPSEHIDFRYPDGSHDVEAMYVASSGEIFLITKRPLRSGSELRPALVFGLASDTWSSKTTATAALVDSLPIVPGSAPLRTISDASLSPDGKHLAVRTYVELYVFAVDSATGRIRGDVRPSVCNIVRLGEAQGEGITWASNAGRFAFTSEGNRAPLHLASCPLPP